jgi:hypothetical protein
MSENSNEPLTSNQNSAAELGNRDSAEQPDMRDRQHDAQANSSANQDDSGSSERKEEGGRQSPGPRTAEGKARSSQNSRTHGLFARELHFNSQEEREQFEELHEELRQDRNPKGALQDMIVRLMARCLWRLLQVQERIAAEFSKRDNTNWASTLQHFMGKSNSLKLPVPGIPQPDAANSKGRETWTPWQCTELSLKLVGGDHNVQNLHEVSGQDLQFVKDMKNKRSRNDTVQRFELELKLGDSLETYRRYEAALKRELFQYIEILDRLQRRKATHND